MNETYVHMHDGESVYYEDTCYVCEAQQIERDEMVPQFPRPELTEVKTEVKKAESAPYYRYRREFPWYEVRNVFQVIAWVGAAYGIWVLGFILLSLLLHGTVKW